MIISLLIKLLLYSFYILQFIILKQTSATIMESTRFLLSALHNDYLLEYKFLLFNKHFNKTVFVGSFLHHYSFHHNQYNLLCSFFQGSIQIIAINPDKNRNLFMAYKKSICDSTHPTNLDTLIRN